MNTPLAGKIAFIHGGSRGIGAATARRLARDGATVAIGYAAPPPSPRTRWWRTSGPPAATPSP